MGLCRKVVEFVRLCFLNDPNEIGRISEITVVENKFSMINMWILINMIDSCCIETLTTAYDAMNDVVFFSAKDLPSMLRPVQ